LKLAREKRLEAEKLVQQKTSPALVKRWKKEAEKRIGGEIRTVNDLAEQLVASTWTPRPQPGTFLHKNQRMVRRSRATAEEGAGTR